MMGNLQLMICVNCKNFGVEKIIKEEIEEILVVEIYFNCFLNMGLFYFQWELRKDIDIVEVVELCSVEIIEIKFYFCIDDEWLLDLLLS